MLDLEVFVPSRSRWEQSRALEMLQGQWDHVALVVPAAQQAKYAPLAKRHGARVIPCGSDGIAKTRQFIGAIARNKFIMIDDDLRFFWRESREDKRLFQIKGTNKMAGLLIYISRLLDEYAHVSVSPRGGNHVITNIGYPTVLNKRPLRALAYRKWPFMQCKHGRVAIMEDFDVTLQLIAMGYQHCQIVSYAQDHIHTQEPGGCSDYRTHEMHEENVRKMAKLHPGIVKIVEKKNKTGGEFGTRIDATIYWEKAWKQAMADIL